ncbi:MAG: hypothetical protein JW736_01055 [Deltaproteobacteria bacterium]|nr:hypothetical protein [Deltaproteobacteria bacterium]MBN2845208.1 hypothetical protein [Deltaproteobacteria bacterium]
MDSMNLKANIEQGEFLYEKGRIGEAEALFAGLLQKEPANCRILNNLGVIAFARADVAHSLQYFIRALEIDRCSEDALQNITAILKKYPQKEGLPSLLKESVAANAFLSPSSRMSDADAAVLSDKKIIHCPFEIAGNMARITRYLRAHGVHAMSANYYDSWLQYHCDINLNINSLPQEKKGEAIDAFARQTIDEYDIFHFHFAHSLYPDLHDLEELRGRDKKILFSFWGSDMRSPECFFYNMARFLGYDPPRPYTFTFNLYVLHKTINQYADVMLGSPYIPRWLRIPGLIDSYEWTLDEKRELLKKKAIEKDPCKIYFLHAPSTGWKKGTKIIMGLLDECKQEGMPIEVLYVSGMPPEKAKPIYAHADFAIDQIAGGTFGLFGNEMMCWEIPVLVYQNEEWDTLRGFPPVINITRDTFKEKIAHCVEMKKNGTYDEWGHRCRQWVLANTDFQVSLPRYLNIYSSLVRGEEVPQYCNRNWYRQEQMLQSGVKSDFYRYMIEEKIFDHIGLEISNYDKRLYR